MRDSTRQNAKSNETQKESFVSRRPGEKDSQGANTPIEQIMHLQRTVGNRAVTRLIRSGVLQAKLKIGLPNDIYEQEADRMAERVVSMPEPGGGIANNRKPMVQRASCPEKENEEAQLDAAPSVTPEVTPGIESEINAMKGGGQPLPESTRNFFEPRFGADFSGVRIHNDSHAAQTAQAINAKAFTTGRDVFFNTGQYAPGSSSGDRLIAHELTHVMQQYNYNPNIQRKGQGRYTIQERKKMAEGKVKGTKKDKKIASSHGFKPGDIVFRLGSEALAERIGNPVTHGGIYLGNGVIHDMVGFGNRHVRVELFFKEAEIPSKVKIIRFTGPHTTLILSRLLKNIKERNFHLPSDPKPWNLFSSASNYKTATCLEYIHAQFLYAIKSLTEDKSVSKDIRASLLKTYYDTSGVKKIARNLIQPQTLTVKGLMGYARNELRLYIAVADCLAEDVDPSVFENRFEGTEELKMIGTIFRLVFIQILKWKAFTHKSFADSRKYFSVVK